MNMEKQCKKCCTVKAYSDFYIDTRTSKPMARCIACRKHAVTDWMHTEHGKTSHAACERLRRENDPVGIMLALARQRAKRSGLEFTLKREDVSIPERCPVLDIPLFRGKRAAKDNSPSLDRIDSRRGYTPDNIAVISWRANRLKGDATIQELVLVLKYVTDRT